MLAAIHEIPTWILAPFVVALVAVIGGAAAWILRTPRSR